jgi:hypothetical protein
MSKIRNYLLGSAALFASMSVAMAGTITSFPISTLPMPFYNAQSYGWLPDTTDRSTQMLAMLAAICPSGVGGGTIYFPPSSAGRYRADSQMLIPNTGATLPTQCNLRLTGGGGGPVYNTIPAGAATSAPPMASILDLRYQSGNQNGKIETRGLGNLVIDNLTIKDGGSSNATPLIHDTNTTLTISGDTFIGSGSATQDAIVLGGTSAVENDGGLNAYFQGYGTRIVGNSFLNLNRGFYLRAAANGVIIDGNTWSYGNAGTIAGEIDGSAMGSTSGVVVSNSIIEMVGYVYGFKLTACTYCTFVNNGFFDSHSGTSVNDYYLNAGSSGNLFNTFILGYSDSIDGDLFSTNGVFGGDTGSYEASLVIGGTTSGNGAAIVKTATSRTSGSGFNLPSGTAPTSPNDGDTWYDGTNMKFQIGATTESILTGQAPVTATTPSAFSATTRIPVKIGATTYYVPADTSTW